jgi:hypothetical protein
MSFDKFQSTSWLHIPFTDYPEFPIIRENSFPIHPENRESAVLSQPSLVFPTSFIELILRDSFCLYLICIKKVSIAEINDLQI